MGEVIAREPGAGHWVAFSRYEIIDGGIRPAAGAAMTWWSPWQRRSEQPPPYETLVNLVQELSAPPLDTVSEAKLLAWIAQHGVLGVLPHETIVATLWPRWRLAGEYREPGKPAPLLPSITTYHQVGGKFEEVVRAQRTASSADVVAREGEARLLGEPVGDRKILDELRRQGWPEPAVVRRPFKGGAPLIAEPLADAWGRYFLRSTAREVRAKWRYPAPLSADFWSAYVEGIDEFLSAAHQLRRALTELAEAPHGYEQSGGDTLSRLIGPIGFDLVFGSGGVSEAWRGPSLLSMLAVMAALDVARDGRVRICVCKTLFVSHDQRVEYCSPRCRWRAHQRAYRARSRAEKQKKAIQRTSRSRRSPRGKR